MSLARRAAVRIAALLGISAWSTSAMSTVSLETVDAARAALGGQITPLPTTKLRWHLGELETAQYAADVGQLHLAAQLCRAMRRDGVLKGVMSTRCDGLVQLPKRFFGDEEIVSALQTIDGASTVFDAMCPPAELAALAWDEVFLGVAVGELVPVEGRDYPVLVRLDPEWLVYRWSENRWYYNSIVGPIPITPGDGRWVLHIGGGRVSPWQNGLWPSLGRAWINKEHALNHRANWEAKLANPARVAVAPQGASEEQKLGWFRKVMAWGVNTVFALTPGYDVKLLESNGRGFESFNATIDQSEREYMIAIAGQIVTVTGGSGFANADIHKSIRADLIKSTGDRLAFTLSTQVIPPYVAARWGVDALARCPSMNWDTTPPADLKADADAIGSAAEAINKMNAALTQYEKRVDAMAIASRYGIPTKDLESKVQAPSVTLAPSNVIMVVRVNEARAALGLGPLLDESGNPDPKGELIVSDLAVKAEEQTVDGEDSSADGSDEEARAA